MLDITSTLSGKGSQLNADDLPLEGKIIKITQAKITGGEQPLVLHYEEELGRPFLPCLTMRRVLAHIWGTDASAYVGRALLVYRDPEVVWAGRKVGGVRIKGASHIDAPVSYTATVSKGKKQTVTIQPLSSDARTEQTPQSPPENAPTPEPNRGDRARAEEFVNKTIARINSTQSNADLMAITSEQPLINGREKLRKLHTDLEEKMASAINAKLSSLEAAEEAVW